MAVLFGDFQFLVRDSPKELVLSYGYFHFSGFSHMSNHIFHHQFFSSLHTVIGLFSAQSKCLLLALSLLLVKFRVTKAMFLSSELALGWFCYSETSSKRAEENVVKICFLLPYLALWHHFWVCLLKQR